jgi:hypothetical protein
MTATSAGAALREQPLRLGELTGNVDARSALACRGAAGRGRMSDQSAENMDEPRERCRVD